MTAPEHRWPAKLKIRDTGLFDDTGGSGQRIYTTAGFGYERIEYLRSDLAPDARSIREAALREAYDAVGLIVSRHEVKEDFRAEEIAGECHDAILALIGKGTGK